MGCLSCLMQNLSNTFEKGKKKTQLKVLIHHQIRSAVKRFAQFVLVHFSKAQNSFACAPKAECITTVKIDFKGSCTKFGRRKKTLTCLILESHPCLRLMTRHMPEHPTVMCVTNLHCW